MAHTLVSYPTKPRTFILTDITNEPDDAQSFCRYLTYSNQFDTKGIVPTTSTWLRNRVAPEALHDILDGYSKVVDNLNAHTHPENPYPTPELLRNLIKSGTPVYGMEAVGDNIPLSDGAKLLLQCLEEDDTRPLWILVWSGVNVLASVLHHIRKRPDAAELRAKLRIYTISDQDDTGAWIRLQWPELFYICSIHGWNQYMSAVWLGISGSVDVGGANSDIVSSEYIKQNFQVGPLGEKYPDVMYAMEGDTPTFLYMIQNGLGVPEQPSWGGWGGRYVPVNVSMLGAPKGHHADSFDAVTGQDGKRYATSHATIWRWREAFQHDFAARMQWTLTSDFSKANHHPVVVVNGNRELTPLYIDIDAGSSFLFDASASTDPDGDTLAFKWWQYREPSAIQTYHAWEVAELGLQQLEEGKKVWVSVPPPEKSCAVIKSEPFRTMKRGPPLHLILEVEDDGSPRLISYRRVVITPVNRDWKDE